jgi:predicted flap endonuclease-1-like 5' DNA nuclease
MPKAESVNTPWLGGWIIGAAAGLVAFGALIAVGEFNFSPAAAIGIVVALLVGLILGMPWDAGDSSARTAAAVIPVAEAPRAAAPAAPEATPAAFVSEPAPFVSTPAAFVSAPVPAAVASSDGPERLTAPRGGKADNLKEIEGIGPAMEKLVNDMGFYHFEQIASWTESDVAWVDANMTSFKGRITRDKWVSQARIIVTEGLEAFRIRAKTNNY